MCYNGWKRTNHWWLYDRPSFQKWLSHSNKVLFYNRKGVLGGIFFSHFDGREHPVNSHQGLTSGINKCLVRSINTLIQHIVLVQEVPHAAYCSCPLQSPKLNVTTLLSHKLLAWLIDKLSYRQISSLSQVVFVSVVKYSTLMENGSIPCC